MRLALEETGNPCRAPADRLVTPRASSSWFGSMRYPFRAAIDRAVRTLSVNPTRTIPRATGSRAVRSSRPISGRAGAGSPWGTAPTTGTAGVDPGRAQMARVAPATAIRAPGSWGAQRRSPSTRRSERVATARVDRSTEPSSRTSSATLGKKRPASIGTPVKAAIWLERRVSPTPVM